MSFFLSSFFRAFNFSWISSLDKLLCQKLNRLMAFQQASGWTVGVRCWRFHPHYRQQNLFRILKINCRISCSFHGVLRAPQLSFPRNNCIFGSESVLKKNENREQTRERRKKLKCVKWSARLSWLRKSKSGNGREVSRTSVAVYSWKRSVGALRDVQELRRLKH